MENTFVVYLKSGEKWIYWLWVKKKGSQSVYSMYVIFFF